VRGQHGGVAVKAAQVGVGRGRRAARRLHQRPVRHQPAQHQRLGRAQEGVRQGGDAIAAQAAAFRAIEFGEGLHRRSFSR